MSLNLSYLKEIYKKNTNILDFLRVEKNTNKLVNILISYDLQSGSYCKNFEKNPKFYQNFTKELSHKINELGAFDSILEAGVGEATTLINLLVSLGKPQQKKYYGFDLSWSRLRYAKEFSKKFNFDVDFFTGDLFSIPVADESIDIVYTSHSIEPNGGREEEALKELYRITKKYLILLEPDYERGSETARARMTSNGYITNLNQTIRNLGYQVILDEPFKYSSNKLNPTGLKIIKKVPAINSNRFQMICPHTKLPIKKLRNVYTSDEGGLIYPIIDEIPCLLQSNAIIATHFNEF